MKMTFAGLYPGCHIETMKPHMKAGQPESTHTQTGPQSSSFSLPLRSILTRGYLSRDVGHGERMSCSLDLLPGSPKHHFKEILSFATQPLPYLSMELPHSKRTHTERVLQC